MYVWTDYLLHAWGRFGKYYHSFPDIAVAIGVIMYLEVLYQHNVTDNDFWVGLNTEPGPSKKKKKKSHVLLCEGGASN